MQKLMVLSYVCMGLALSSVVAWLGEPALAWVLCDLLDSRIC